jgi:S-adenosylmethionine:tRNA-ribosyltransferase-isomerase (queuine synthetase)
MLHVAALAAALMAFPPTASIRDFPHVRTSSALLSLLIADARDHSPTFVRLVESIESSDLIVYFEATPHMESRFRGRVHFMGASAGYRYLRVQIRTAMNRFDIMASLAHEMQHANEIAAHPEVVSEAGLAVLYRDIGDEHDWCMFETNAAQEAGRAVRAEILAP